MAPLLNYQNNIKIEILYSKSNICVIYNASEKQTMQLLDLSLSTNIIHQKWPAIINNHLSILSYSRINTPLWLEANSVGSNSSFYSIVLVIWHHSLYINVFPIWLAMHSNLLESKQSWLWWWWVEAYLIPPIVVF